ncbi:hypothetical protein [Sanguibacter sp. HDW7]|uniref:hypothetical protein n=1 Tax=Sanguibacter sp. HDW7 TaxID=2714931 RepID=UPI00140BAA9C|nr:hypothetical protein [Sanguibacter sp. HDW7]QIK84363.1 hypothetical protein G7063_12605 [Sanguibacter sp. HDW7]
MAFVGGVGLLYLAYREIVRPWGSDMLTTVSAIVGATILLSFSLRPGRNRSVD